MTKGQKIGGGAVILLIIALIYYGRKKGWFSKGGLAKRTIGVDLPLGQESHDSGTTGKDKQTYTASTSFPIKLWDSGDMVAKIQHYINTKRPELNIEEDGDFGPVTEGSLQQVCNVTTVDKDLYKTIASVVKVSPPKPISKDETQTVQPATVPSSGLTQDQTNEQIILQNLKEEGLSVQNINDLVALAETEPDVFKSFVEKLPTNPNTHTVIHTGIDPDTNLFNDTWEVAKENLTLTQMFALIDYVNEKGSSYIKTLLVGGSLLDKVKNIL